MPNQSDPRVETSVRPSVGCTSVVVIILLVAAIIAFGWYKLYHYSDDRIVVTRHVQTNPGKTYAPSAPNCDGVTSTGLTGGNIIAINRELAGTTEAADYLDQLRCSEVNEVIYGSGYVPSGELENWLAYAEAAGFMTSFQVNATFEQLGTDEARVDYIREISDDANLKTCYIALNTAPRNKALDKGVPGSHAVELWKGLIAEGGCREARVLEDFIPEATAESMLVTPDVIVYLPVGDPSGYAPTDAYNEVGQQAFENSGTQAIVGIQAMSQGDDDRPSPEEVGDFATGVHGEQHPVWQIILYSQGPDASDTQYIADCARYVRKVIG